MQPLSLAEALASAIHELKDPATKAVKKAIPENIYLGIRNKSPDFILAPSDFSEYLALVCSLLNYSASPSPSPFNDLVVATDILANPKAQKSIASLLSSSGTHVIKLLDPGLPGRFVDVLPKSQDNSHGLSSDTLEAPIVLNMSGAADLAFSPFWLATFKMPWGEVTDHLSVLMTSRGSQAHHWFMDALARLGAQAFAGSLNQAAALASQSFTDDVIGKLVRFPLSPDAAATDNYMTLSPVPSASMVVEFNKRYFNAVAERKAIPKAELQNHVFGYPVTANVSVGGANPQNCGSTASMVNGKVKAFLAHIPSQSVVDGRTNGRLIAKLQSGRGSLLVIDKAAVKFLLKTHPTSALRQNWQSNLPDVVADILGGLISLRENGLPTEVVEPRFSFAIERDFVMKTLAGDKQERSLTPNDLHLLGLHVRDQVQHQIVKRTQGLGLDYDRQETLYAVVIDLLR
ncbi:type I-F CRISPR-associated protein Csy1 [Pseudomonas sp. S1(2024)]|uniref:type I-F CRISPR-associated protein Csy1 n=1 Tax=Pseudomonas sp. S1(2024) TaxID=3390191 RepID=UPI0039782F0E